MSSVDVLESQPKNVHLLLEITGQLTWVWFPIFFSKIPLDRVDLHREHAERLKHQHQGTLVLTVSQSENAPFQHGDDASVSEPVASQLVEKTMWARRAQQDQVCLRMNDSLCC